jgi:hypothetical protein
LCWACSQLNRVRVTGSARRRWRLKVVEAMVSKDAWGGGFRGEGVSSAT